MTNVIIYLISSLASLSIILYFLLKGKKDVLLFSFIGFQTLVFLWSAGDLVFELNFKTEIYSMFGFELVDFLYSIDDKLHFLVLCFAGVSWLLFCLYYTEHKVTKNKFLPLLLIIPPSIFYTIILINKYQRVFFNLYSEPDLLFLLHAATSYFYFFAGAIILWKHAKKQPGYAKKQAQLLVYAISIPLMLSLYQDMKFQLFKLDIFPFFDVTPVGFSFSMLIIAVATYNYRFLNIAPIALRNLVDDMNQSIIVVDLFNRIIDFNKSLVTNFSTGKLIKRNDDIALFVNVLQNKIENRPNHVEILKVIESPLVLSYNGELNITPPEQKFYNINIRPLSRKKEMVGRVIIFNDITEYRRLAEELNKKNTELSIINEELVNANLKLQEYAATVEELTIIKERNRFAGDVHDTLGHSMTVLITLLKVCDITCGKDPEETKKKIAEASEVAKEGLRELRRSISGLVPERLEMNNPINAIKNLIASFEASGIRVDFTVDGTSDRLEPKKAGVIFRVCQEALTNSLRHGKASRVTIVLRFLDGRIKLFLVDNGSGCLDIKKGFGLLGMEQRVKEVEGTIEYGSDGKHGFNIYVEIPIV